jgi:hypothetical protein
MTSTRRFASLFFSCVSCIALAPLAACEPYGAPIAPSAQAPDAPHAPDMQVISTEQAASAGLHGTEVSMPSADDSDGAQMLEGWLDAARARGISRVSDVTLYVVRASAEGAVECRVAFYPQDGVEPRWVPGTTKLVSVSRPVTRSVTRYEQRCRMVSKPVMRTETTYSSQYDSYSKSYRQVPQTRTVTKYEMQNECRSEPVMRMETRWEYTFERRYEAPRVEYLATKRLRETSPACYAASPGATSRVEGKVYRGDVVAPEASHDDE